MDIEEVKKQFEKEYLMVSKGKWWSFLGGAFAFLIATGLVSYKASMEAISSTPAENAILEIENIKSIAGQELESIEDTSKKAEKLVLGLENDVGSVKEIDTKLEDIKKIVSSGNKWEKLDSKNIKNVSKDTNVYEYAMLRNGSFRKLTFSTWNDYYIVMTDIYMAGDYEHFSTEFRDRHGDKFRLGGSLWRWSKHDERVYHLYYFSTPDGFIAFDGNGFTKADSGGEGDIYRRPIK